MYSATHNGLLSKVCAFRVALLCDGRWADAPVCVFRITIVYYPLPKPILKFSLMFNRCRMSLPAVASELCEPRTVTHWLAPWPCVRPDRCTCSHV